jgi:hypothetical protein
MSKSLFVNVPQYYPQTDSHTAHADRMCFSSTNAMAIKFLRPGALKGVNADDDYLRVVLKYGDTTEWTAQQRAIRTFGLESRFTKKASIDDLRRILSEGRPVPVGFLHHGPASAPRADMASTCLARTTSSASRACLGLKSPQRSSSTASG